MRIQNYTPEENARLEWVGGVINGEAKMLAAAIAIHTFGDNPFTAFALHGEIVKRQDTPAAWVPDVYVPFMYCNTLRGIVFESGVRGRQPCRLLPSIRARALGTCGLGLDWALEYPHLPLYQLLGKSTAGKASQPAAMRLKLFTTLLDNPGPQTHLALSKALNWQPKLIRKNSDTLASLGALIYHAGHSNTRASAIELRPDFIEPLANLCDRFQSGRNLAADEHIDRVKDIIDDESSMQLLMTKAKRFSTSANLHINRGREEISVTLIRLVEELGDVSIKQAIAEVAVRTGRTLNRGTMDTAFSRLKYQGRVIATMKPCPYSGRQVLHYGLPRETLQ